MRSVELSLGLLRSVEHSSRLFCSRLLIVSKETYHPMVEHSYGLFCSRLLSSVELSLGLVSSVEERLGLLSAGEESQGQWSSAEESDAPLPLDSQKAAPSVLTMSSQSIRVGC
jgi:hypothetical protein